MEFTSCLGEVMYMFKRAPHWYLAKVVLWPLRYVDFLIGIITVLGWQANNTFS